MIRSTDSPSKRGRPSTGRPHYVRRLISLPLDVDADLSRLMRRYGLGRAPTVARLIQWAARES